METIGSGWNATRRAFRKCGKRSCGGENSIMILNRLFRRGKEKINPAIIDVKRRQKMVELELRQVEQAVVIAKRRESNQ